MFINAASFLLAQSEFDFEYRRFGGAPDTAPAPGAEKDAGGLTTVFDGVAQSRADLFARPQELVETITQINPVWAGIFVFFGGLSLFHGNRWHKLVVVILAMLVGISVGSWVGPEIGSPAVASVALAILFGVLSMPLMRFSVALFGGLAGAVVGANCWSALGGEPTMHLWGAATGLIAVGLLAFVAYKQVIILFTAVGGAALVAIGGLSLALQVPAWEGAIIRTIESHNRIVPLAVAVAALVGAIIQQANGFTGLKDAADAADKNAQANAKAAA